MRFEIIIVDTPVAVKDSRRSEQLPAISFTRSPIKSAIVFGILESSSGILNVTLPTRSADISAAFV